MTTKLPIQFTNCTMLYALQNKGISGNLWFELKTGKLKQENMNLTFQTNFRMIKNWHEFQHFNKVYMPIFASSLLLRFYHPAEREEKKSQFSLQMQCSWSEEADWEWMASWILCTPCSTSVPFGITEWCPDSFNSHFAI